MLVRRGRTRTPGSIYIKVSRLDGTAALFGPAPAGMDGGTRGAPWRLASVANPLPDHRPEAEADAYLARQIEFDPDIWIVSVEDRQGRHFLEDWLAA